VNDNPTDLHTPVDPTRDLQGEAGPDLAGFLELSAQIMCITDLTSTVLWCNEAFERSLGYGTNELLGARIDDLIHPQDAEASDQFERSESARPGLRAGSAAEEAPGRGLGLAPVRFRTREGRWRWLEWTTRVDVERERLYGVARDITDRRQDEAALGDSEARLAAIMKYSPSAIFVKDLEGVYLVVNDEFARATGVPVDQAVGATAQCLWPQDIDTIADRERQLLADGTALVSNDRMHTVDGTRDFIVHRFLLRDEQGEAYAIGGIATDVTMRIGAEKALYERERLLDSVIRASPDMITLMDRAGKIHQISEAETVMFGYPHEVFARTGLFEFVHPDDFDDVASMFVRMVSGAVSHLHLRYRVRHADGHWVVVDSRARAVLDAEDHFAGAVVVSRDVSDRLESEQRLKESRDAAEKASRAKSDFLSRMSHELRTPLNSILGFAQLLQMDDLPEQSADAVEHILRAGRHLLNLIDEVLDIARIEAGHLELAMNDVGLGEVVAEAIELTSPIAARSDVTIRTSGSLGDEVVVADRQRLMQVLLNLLSNAVKYNRPGGRVDVMCAPVAPGVVRLAVADTGRGIEPDDIERVFLPFDRLGAEQSGIEGTGVGLALSHHLCERMGGTLGVESVPGVGSTFFVDLPAAAATTLVDDAGGSTREQGSAGTSRALGSAQPGPFASNPAARIGGIRGDAAVGGAGTGGAETAGAIGATESMEPAGSRPHAEPRPLAGLPRARSNVAPGSFRVLLIEDNLATLDLVERVLSRRPGTEVLASMQGGLGVELAREHTPDLVLLDLQLPDMAGDAVLDRLAEDPATAAIPVAVVGADAPSQLVRQFLQRGVVGYLDKPIDVHGLLSVVDAVRAARGS
jgi:PAS domain S-box-containing protein